MKSEVEREERLKIEIDLDPFEAHLVLDGNSIIEFQVRLLLNRIICLMIEKIMK